MPLLPFHLATVPLPIGITRIEASAGTGKTYTLTALFLRLIVEENLPVNSILVTTFTIAATAELRDRIRSRLHLALSLFTSSTPTEDPLLEELRESYLANASTYRPRLEAALRQFDDASISTIHGFCQRLLQERAFESSQAFDAELLTDSQPLLQEVADDFWRTQFYPAPPRLAAFAINRHLSASSLVNLLAKISSHPTLEILPPYRPTHLASSQATLLTAFDNLQKAWTDGETTLREIFADAKTWAKGDLKKIELTTPILDSLDHCFQNPHAQPADYLALIAFTTKNLTADTAKRGSGTPTHPFFDDAQTLSAAWDDYLLALQLEFLHSAPQELQKRKLQRNVLSFDDLLVHLLSALQGPSGPALIAATRSRFSAALVDEFQDTDPTQAAIFQTLFQNDGRLWLIGDPKQAIYAFRGADVFSYLNAVEQAQFHYSLSSNQRSITPLVEAVNHFFKAGSPSFVVPGINFLNSTPAGRQDPNALDNSPPFKFWLCSHEKPLSKGKATPQINLAVTNAIVSQLQSSATIAGRPLAPSDFAVLTKTNYEAKELHAKLSAAGLPAIVMGSASVLQSEEARELLAILHAISNPTREDFLRAALATITLGYNSPSIHDLSTDLPEWESILTDFSKHHQDWLKHGFAPAFRRFLITWQVRPRLLAFFDGERRLTNLLHLAELLHEAAISQDLGPASLPTWLATQMDPQTKTTDAHEQRLESDEAAVKVVTVHKSKGLEFNLVWVPFSWTNADPRKNAPVVFHNPQNTLTLDLGSLDLEAHHAILAQELLAEDARLLYVALTRAKLQCNFIWGRFHQSEVSAANWILHPPSPNPASAVADLKTHKLDDPTFRSQISHLVDSHPTAFSATDLPPVTDPLQRWTPPPTTNLPKEARTFTGSISRDWRISSFSSLISHTHPDLPDYDRPTTANLPTNPNESGIHAFPRGTRAGTCLHAIFEKLDFTDDSQINPLVEAQLQIAGFSSPANLQAVSHTVRQTLATELLPGLRLQQIPKSQRLTEADFHLPVGNLSPAHLKDLLGEDLDFYTFKGFLKGFIDLIFQHDGRFYLLDWKSNHLGSSSDHYTPEAMEAEMRKHHYHLQFHLYTVALHRYLKLRIPNYLPENHFGGVFYLFLRGINPAQPSLGVFHQRPDPQLIARLETLFPTSIPHAQ